MRCPLGTATRGMRWSWGRSGRESLRDSSSAKMQLSGLARCPEIRTGRISLSDEAMVRDGPREQSCHGPVTGCFRAFGM